MRIFCITHTLYIILQKIGGNAAFSDRKVLDPHLF